MSDQLQFSEEFTDMAKALHELQYAIGPVIAKEVARVKTKTGGEYSYKFANLADCIELVREPLHANGLCVVCGVEAVSPVVTITTRIIHTGGQWVETTVRLPIDDTRMSTAQAVGSAITFGRRYTLCALLGIASEDDDGKAAGNAKRQQPPATSQQQPAQAPPQPVATSDPLDEPAIAQLRADLIATETPEAVESIVRGAKYQRLRASGPEAAYKSMAKLASSQVEILKNPPGDGQ